jgi:outer membrane immunogenic protein
MMPDVSGLDDALNVGILFGGYIMEETSFGSIAIEGEITTSISDGDVSINGERGDWDIDVIAIYAAYRSQRTIYFKGKIGLLYEDAKVKTPSRSASNDDIGLSLGIGGGWRIMDRSSLELEYTFIEDDINFFSLAFVRTF